MKAAVQETEKQAHRGSVMIGIKQEFIFLDIRNMIDLSKVSSCFMAHQKLSWTKKQKKAAAVVC